MPRLLVGDSWYESIASQSWYEADYERLVIDRAPALFPSWICVSFKEIVEGEDGARHRPDLAFVDPEYRHWWVVEVELAHHDLYGHVMPQVESFKTGRYGYEHAVALAAEAPSLELDRLQSMLLGDPPDVVVVVDTPNTKWRDVLGARGVALTVVEPFRNPSGTVILRLNGEYPDAPTSVLTRCVRYSYRRLWRVLSPAALPSGESLLIEYGGSVSEWRRVNLANSIMLQSVRGDILADLSAVDLVRRDDNTLAFMPTTSMRPRRIKR